MIDTARFITDEELIRMSGMDGDTDILVSVTRPRFLGALRDVANFAATQALALENAQTLDRVLTTLDESAKALQVVAALVRYLPPVDRVPLRDEPRGMSPL